MRPCWRAALSAIVSNSWRIPPTRPGTFRTPGSSASRRAPRCWPGSSRSASPADRSMTLWWERRLLSTACGLPAGTAEPSRPIAHSTSTSRSCPDVVTAGSVHNEQRLPASRTRDGTAPPRSSGCAAMHQLGPWPEARSGGRAAATAGTIGAMVKTTVYLDERDAAALRRMAAESGRSQADIIREAIGRTTRELGPRRLRSAAAGHGAGAPVARDADEIVRAELGRSTR